MSSHMSRSLNRCPRDYLSRISPAPDTAIFGPAFLASDGARGGPAVRHRRCPPASRPALAHAQRPRRARRQPAADLSRPPYASTPATAPVADSGGSPLLPVHAVLSRRTCETPAH
jgi:hypothetical protein